MKYFKRLGVYKASNVKFDPNKIEAYSYGWWRFVAVVEGKVVFNTYRYSNSTSKHQYKVARLMDELGIKIDISMPLRRGILKKGEMSYRNGSYEYGKTLEEMIVSAEEELCDKFWYDILKKQERYERQKKQRLLKKEQDRLNKLTEIETESEPVQSPQETSKPTLKLIMGGRYDF